MTASIWDPSTPTFSFGTVFLLSNIAALRTFFNPLISAVFLPGYTVSGDGGGGIYYYDTTDVISADNGGTIIIDSLSRRWKLSYDGAVSIKKFGAATTKTNAQNKTALQAAISAADIAGSGDIYVPPDINYGYSVTPSTWPNFTGVVSDALITIYDASIGNSYVAPDKEGTQTRVWYYTKQNVPPNHDGNGFIVSGWQGPYTFASNESELTGLATDNRRAFHWVGTKKKPIWGVGQGTAQGALTELQLTNFCLRFYGSIIGSPLGDCDPLLVDATTGAFGFHTYSNSFDAGYIFKKPSAGLYTAVFQAATASPTISEVVFRTNGSSAQDMGFRSLNGDLSVRAFGIGDCATWIRATRRLSILTSWRSARQVVVYSAAMAIDSTVANSFSITATNAVAFTVNAPSGGEDGISIKIRIRNTSGGALGVATFAAGYKLGAAWVQPANGFSRVIEFEFDGANWVETFRSAADIAN